MKLSGIRLSALLVMTVLASFPVLAQLPSGTSANQTLIALSPEAPAQLSAEALARIQATLDETYGTKALSAGGYEVKVAAPFSSVVGDGAVKPLSTFETTANGDLKIEIVLDKFSFKALHRLQQLGLEISLVDRKRDRIVAACPIDGLHENLAKIAAEPFVKTVQPILGSRTNHGSVLSEGDAALGADLARADFSVDGSGVRVCVISDGVESAADAVLTGDLPADSAGNPAIELCPLNNNSGDEGTAMLEIIHDLAPGATLGFCPAFGNGEAGLANAIDWLANDAFGGQGCEIIADDVAILTEPYFQDGIVAQATDAAAANGVAFFDAAGNSADEHYQQWYNDVNPFNDSSRGENIHNFGSLGDPDINWNGRVGGSGTEFFAFLQWEEPFGGASLDFDLFIFDINGRRVGDPNGVFPIGFNGIGQQNGDDDPLEVAGLRNTLGDGQNPFTGVADFFLLIVGPGDDNVPGLVDIELHFNSNNGAFTVQFPENYVNPDNSIFGGAAAEGAITIAATGAVENQGGVPNPNLDIIEPFSSQGPVVLQFDTNGNDDLDVRFKPDLTAVDGVAVTGAGGFPSPFFGTSAAAPHAAAVAALLQDAAGGTLQPEDFRWILSGTALPRGDSLIWGAGLIDAQAAVESVAFANASNLKLTSMCWSDSTTHRMRVRNTNSFPVAYTWDVYGSSQTGSGLAAANSDTFFDVSGQLGNGLTVRLFWNGGSKSTTKAANQNSCH